MVEEANAGDKSEVTSYFSATIHSLLLAMYCTHVVAIYQNFRIMTLVWF
jgi:hypothetical protein